MKAKVIFIEKKKKFKKIQKKHSKKNSKKIQNSRLKKAHFPAPPIINIFLWKFDGLVLGLVELIDAKGIGVAQLIWLWGCLT